MKKVLPLLFLCLASPLMAAEAEFRDGRLRLDAVRVGSDVYEAELALSPNSDPMTFTLTSARKLTGVTDVAATFSGMTLAIPNVLVNGKQRFSAQLSLTGSSPQRFRLAYASLLRGLSFPLEGQTIAAEQFMTLTYTGAALSKDNVKLSIGGMELATTVADNTIIAPAPNIPGATTLQVELNGDKFSFPITISGTAPILNPRSYVSTFADELGAMLRQAQLPATLLDGAAIRNELAKLSESEAKRLAEQLRANLGPLLQDIGDTGGVSLQALRYFANNEELDKWCVATGTVYLSRVKLTALAGAATLVFAETGQAIGTLISATTMVAVATGALNVRNQTVNVGCYDLSPFTDWERIQEMHDNVTLARELEFFEDRPQAMQLTEVREVRSGEFASLYREASRTLVDIARKVKNAMLSVPFVSNSSTAVVFMDNLIATINVDGVEEVEGMASKYKVKSISDSRISVEMMPIGGATVFVFNQVAGDIPVGQSIRFTLELYNEEDDITMKVPILLRGASMLEDLKDALVGNWLVYNLESNSVTDLKINRDGTGIYSPERTRDSCPNGGTVRGRFCDYRMTWYIEVIGDKYYFHDEGFWHPGYEDDRLVDWEALSLPLSAFSKYANNSTTESIRYRKL